MPTRRSRRFGVLALELHRGDLAAAAAAAACAGVDGISVGIRDLRRLGLPQVERILADTGLAISSMGAIGPDLSHELGGATDDDLEVLDAAAALGAPGVLALTGPLGDLSSREADTRCRRWLDRVAPHAADLGIVVMFEPVFPLMRGYTYVHTLSHALELAADVDGAAVVLDLGHVWWDPRLLEQFRDRVDDIGIVQLTNMSSDAMDRYRYSRSPLHDGEIPLRELVRAFDDAGYRGWYEHEVLTKQPDDHVQFVREARESVRRGVEPGGRVTDPSDVQRLLDIEDKNQLKARYLRFMDRKQWDDWSTGVHRKLHHGGARGRQRLPSARRDRHPGDAVPAETRTCHHAHMPEITLTSDHTALGICAMFDYVG